MILNRVKIKNYRQYRDVEIEFAKGNDKNFTIIQGNNGTGKTTLLNSLSWCLYNSEIHDYGDAVGMTICNNKSVNLANVGDNIEVSVEIEFLDDGEILGFKRTKIFRKLDEELSLKDSKFELIKEEGNNVKKGAGNAFYHRERKIPQDVEDYFFFDGARLSEYFQKTKNQKIKDAVYGLSQLNLLEELSKNLTKVRDQYNDKQKKILPKLGSAQAKVTELESLIENDEKSLKESEEFVDIIKADMKEIDEKLIDKKSIAIEKEVIRNKQLDKLIRSNESKLRNLKINRNKEILLKYPYIMSYSSFVNFLELGEESREKGFIPPKFKKSFIKDLLDSGVCICGTDLNVDIEHRKRLEKLLEETNPLTDNAEEVTLALNQVKEFIIKDIRKFKDYCSESHKEIKALISSQEKLIKEKREIQSLLDANPIDEIRALNKQRKALETQYTKHERNIANRKSAIERNTKKLGEQRKLLNNEKRLEKDANIYGDKFAFTDKQSKIAKELYDTLSEEMRVKVQALTKEKFSKITWKKEEFVDIRIDNNYDVFIKNRLGEEERPGDLSDGEKLCLGLCFMSALHTISGFDLPIIMDTPLGNLDVDMRHNIAEFLPNFVGDKQTVLLVTGTEYTDDFRDTLHRAVGKEYVIDWETTEDGKESKVVLR